MKLTVFTNTDTAANGPSLDGAPTTVGYYGDPTAPADQRIRFSFGSSVPNIDSEDPNDSGLWTVVIEMTPAEAAHLADTIAARAKVHAAAPTNSAQLDWDDKRRGRLS